MSIRSLLQLIVLGAIWGSSFIFMRVQSPVIGPIWTAALRLLIGGGALLAYLYFARIPLGWRKNGRRYLIIGLLNSGIPFLLGAYASLYVPASYAVILNSSSPMFGAVYAAIWLGEALTPAQRIGLLIGSAGVALVTKVVPVEMTPDVVLGAVALLAAAACYGLAGVYLKKFGQGLRPIAIAGGSQWIAGLLLVPGLPFGQAVGPLTSPVIVSVLCLALLCSAAIGLTKMSF